MRKIIYLIIGILWFTNKVYSEPYDKVIDSLSKCITMTDFYEMKAKFYSRSYPAKLERDIGFEYRHIFHEFDYDYSTSEGSYYKGFRFYAIVKNDTIVFGRIEQLHWRGRVEKTVDIKRLEHQVTYYTEKYNEIYHTSLSNDSFIKELTNIRYFSFCCGDACSFIPKEAKRILRYVNTNRRRKIDSWLVNPNPEIQAYAIWGIKQLQKKGAEQTETEKQIIEHLLERNSIIYNCSGCLMGLETPLVDLLQDASN